MEAPLLRDENQQKRYARRRWEQLGIYVSLTVCSQCTWIMFTAVPEEAAAALGVNETLVTLLATIYPILYLPGSVLARRAMRRGGLRSTLLESARWMAFGGAIKVLGGARGSFPATLVGQACAALGQPHLVNTPAALGTTWFPVSERDLASTLGLLGNILGQALGEALSPVVVGASGASPHGAVLALDVVFLVPVVCALAWTSTRFVGGETLPRDASDLASSWGAALRRRHFFALWLAFCVGISVFNTLLSLAAQWLKPCGYSANVVGAMTATFVSFGIPAAALVGALLDQTRAYRPVLRALAVADILATLGLLCARNVVSFYLAFALLGAAMVASSATIMETAVECTYPAPPDVSTGVLFCGGNVLSIATIYVFEALLRSQRGHCRPLPALLRGRGAPVALFVFLTLAVCCGLLLAYRGPYLRLEAERSGGDEYCVADDQRGGDEYCVADQRGDIDGGDHHQREEEEEEGEEEKRAPP
ncbi:hypothetical protein CTAYLR_003584 [Chrysophaeum taylorii]|uniref:Uncharacterized protein n=1 Tax=Chrysophaeum taylorii TaxID=2483200 RepID=A0AAD7ULN9_9STRA|nr:hypothetical protein CTAYLR_003584 [Chrysophaeum taylorii]